MIPEQGRLAVDYGSYAFTGGRFYEAYSYTPSGRLTKKKLRWLHDGRPDIEVEGLWTYDNEGRIATRRFPSNALPHRHFYDGMGPAEPHRGRTGAKPVRGPGRLPKPGEIP